MHQPTKRSEPLHSGSGLGFMRRYYCSMFLPKFSPCLCIVAPHAAQPRNPVVRLHRLHCSTLLPPPPHRAPAPVRVLDTSSVLRYTLCLYARCSSCFDSRLSATIAFPFLHESRRPSACTLRGNLHFHVAAYQLLYTRCL